MASPTATLWQPMSHQTPPPWRVGSQNQASCGPPCSSAVRIRCGGPIFFSTLASWRRALITDGMKI